MKRLMFTMGMMVMRAADAVADATGGAPTPVKPTEKVYSSEKLTKIRADKTAKLAEIRAELDEDKAFELNTQLFDLKNAERTEIAGLKAAENAAEIEAKRSAKIAELSTLVSLGVTLAAVNADKKATDEDKASAKLAFDTAFDGISNQLFGAVPKAAGTPKAGGGTKSGAQKADIVEWYKAHRAAGMDHTAALKAVSDVNGVARGSAWGPVNEYRISIGEKQSD